MTLAIRVSALVVSAGALFLARIVHTPGIITAGEATAVITVGSVAMVVHLTAGWASRGVKAVTTGDKARFSRAEVHHPLQRVTVEADRTRV